VLGVATSLLLSLISGFTQFLGFFARISIPTAVLSVVLGIIVGLTFPNLLRMRWQKNEDISGESSVNPSFRLFSVIIAIVIVVAGVGPFVFAFNEAEAAKTDGMDLVELHRYGPARFQLEMACNYFEDMGWGLEQNLVESQLGLIQVFAGLGDLVSADELIEEVDKSGSLTGHLQGKLYTIRGNIAYERGEFEQAECFYQIALQTIEQNSKAYASLLLNQGVLKSEKGSLNHDKVVDNYAKAKEIYLELDDDIGLAYVLINEGNFYENNPLKAREFYEEAKILADEINDPYLLGSLLLNIGLTYRQQGDLIKAEDLYQDAILKFEEAADLLGQSEVLLNLASLESFKGNNELAKQYLETSESYLQNLDPNADNIHPRKTAVIRSFQADIYDLFGESETAESFYLEALSILSEHPDPLNEAKIRANYGSLLLRLNLLEEARDQLNRAKEIADAYIEEGPHETFGVLYSNLGTIYSDMGDYELALEYYFDAVKIFETIGERLFYAQARENIGRRRIQRILYQRQASQKRVK